MKRLICSLLIVFSLLPTAFGEPLLDYDSYSDAELRTIISEANDAVSLRSYDNASLVVEHFLACLREQGIDLEITGDETRPGDFSEFNYIVYFQDTSKPEIPGDRFSLSCSSQYKLIIPGEFSQDYWTTCAISLMKAIAEVEGTTYYSDIDNLRSWFDLYMPLPLQPNQSGGGSGRGYDIRFYCLSSMEPPEFRFYCN